jgi:hypothetical protein
MPTPKTGWSRKIETACLYNGNRKDHSSGTKTVLALNCISGKGDLNIIKSGIVIIKIAADKISTFFNLDTMDINNMLIPVATQAAREAFQNKQSTNNKSGIKNNALSNLFLAETKINIIKGRK